MFYDIFYKLCQEKGVTPTQVSRDLSIRQSTVSMWKKEGTTPKTATLQNLADYFDVSVKYLLTGDENKRSALYGFFKENQIPHEISEEERIQAEMEWERLSKKIEDRYNSQQRAINNIVRGADEREELLELYDNYLNARGRHKLYLYAGDLITNPENLRPGIIPLSEESDAHDE